MTAVGVRNLARRTVCMKLRWARGTISMRGRLSFIQEVARSIRVSSTNKIKAFSVHEHKRIGELSVCCPHFVKGVRLQSAFSGQL